MKLLVAVLITLTTVFAVSPSVRAQENQQIIAPQQQSTELQEIKKENKILEILVKKHLQLNPTTEICAANECCCKAGSTYGVCYDRESCPEVGECATSAVGC